MARPIKTGLDYFPMDTTFDDNIELLEAEEGLEGLGIVLKIWQKIYKQGYYIDWEKDNVLLFSKKINSEITRVNSVINTCFKRGIFDKNMYDKYKILTSSGIQKRFFTALKSSKRVSISVVKEYRLVNGEYNGVFTEETSVNSEETSVIANIPTEESTQKKVKKNKEEESKLKDNKYNVLFDFYIEADLIHHKTLTPAIKKAIDIAEKELMLDVEQMKRIINRHKKKT